MSNQELLAHVQEATGADKQQILQAAEVLYERKATNPIPSNDV